MQFYVADYLADTAHLNAEQHGAYLLLLMNYWQRGKALPDVNERLATVARTLNDRWPAVRQALEEFFEIRDGFWFHGRIERDLEKVNKQTESAKRAGEASAKARNKSNIERPFNDRSTTVQQAKEQPFNHTDTDTDTDTDTEKNLKTLAPSAKALEATSPVIGSLPLVDKSHWQFTQADLDAWAEAYPAVDVKGELRKMREWFKASPEKMKTRKGIRRFIVRWLSSEQDKPGGQRNVRTDAVLERQKQNLANIEAASRRLEGTHGAGGGFLSEPDASSGNARCLPEGVDADCGEERPRTLSERAVERAAPVGVLSIAQGYRG
jgi:uncharacterized protein YdaU (DUF1376 family)